MTTDRRLIEDYLPIETISAAASSEPRMKGHISTLHVWRARRPLVASRAAVYAALVPGSPETRAATASFMERLARYPGDSRVIAQAAREIQAAHAERCASSNASDAAERPRVLDMFAGGGAIPLEAARLGCEAHAVELNPVAHLIELCTVRYPQQFGASLAEDVEAWGRSVLERTREQVSEYLARLDAPKARAQKPLSTDATVGDAELSVVAHYWTRTVPCPNAQCQGTVPLYRQTWLRRKESGYVALRPVPDLQHRIVRFEKVEATPVLPSRSGKLSEAERKKAMEAAALKSFGFDPGVGSEGSSTVCPFCQAPVSGPYVRRYGDEHGYGQQLMCVIALNPEGTGKLYIVGDTLAVEEEDRERRAEEHAAVLEAELGDSSLDQEIPPTGNAGLATGNSYLYGIRTFRQAFTPRQRLILLTMAREIRRAHERMLQDGTDIDRAKAITTYLGVWLSRLTDRFNTLARWHNARETIESLTSMKRFAMMWDFPELNLFGGSTGDALGNLEYLTAVIRREGQFRSPTTCIRGSATELPYPDGYFDAVITDPPYYNYESYSELSDVCYVWLRPTVGFLYPEHFATPLTPKRKECVAAAYRQGGKDAADRFYEDCLQRALGEANRVTKDGGILVLVYAHKSTAAWATVVEAIRSARYEVVEAWPLDMETKARVAHQDDAALKSNIFIVARKRGSEQKGLYEEVVKPDLQAIVGERVETLWDLGITGADLVIACIGAGLRAITRFSRVEYENGEEVPAARFLAEVEGVVLESVFARLSREFGAPGAAGLGALDAPTRFYLLWRYTYKNVDLEAGDAIIFANGTHVELDTPDGLANGPNPLVLKAKKTYRLRDYRERGSDEQLGLSEGGHGAAVIDALHRTLWLMEHRPALLPRFLRESGANRESLRLVAQALAGPALQGGSLEQVSPAAEVVALGRLTSNWRIVVEDAALTAEERQERDEQRTRQRPLFGGGKR